MTKKVLSVRLSKGQVHYLEEKTKTYGTISDVIRAHIPEKKVIKNFERILKQNGT